MLNALIGYGASPFAQDFLSRQFDAAFKPYPDVTATEQYRKRFATEYSIINSDSKLLALYGTLRRQGYSHEAAFAKVQEAHLAQHQRRTEPVYRPRPFEGPGLPRGAVRERVALHPCRPTRTMGGQPDCRGQAGPLTPLTATLDGGRLRIW